MAATKPAPLGRRLDEDRRARQERHARAKRNPSGRRAPLTMRSNRSAAAPVSSARLSAGGARVDVVREAGEREQFGAERDRHAIKARVAPRAGEVIDGVADLDRIAGGGGERLVHVGDERAGLQAGAVGDRREAVRQLARAVQGRP